MMRCALCLATLLCLVTPWAPPSRAAVARHQWAPSPRTALRATEQEIDTARNADIVAVAESLGIDVNSRNKACCPFHDERTPSFSLTPDKGLYYCFGCGAGGDVIKLYRELKNATYSEAVAALLELPASDGVRRVNRMPQVDATERGRLKRANAIAQRVYADALADPACGGARQYLAKRGVKAQTAAAFGLGFARSGTTRGLTKTVARSDFVDAGVLYDDGQARFASKLVFPIRDASSDTLGFGSRALKVAPDQAKYVNSPGTAVFSKGACLFGLDVAKSAIQKTDEALLVEGYFDVLALHDCGAANAVGVLGVGVTPLQLETAARFSPSRRVVLALDADAAGDAAVRRLCNDVLPTLAAQAGVDVVVMRWPDGCKDAADFVEGRRRAGDSDAAVARAVRDLCAAATAWNDACAIPNEADASSSSSSSPPAAVVDVARVDDERLAGAEEALVIHAPPPAGGQDDLRRKIDELEKQLAALSALVS